MGRIFAKFVAVPTLGQETLGGTVNGTNTAFTLSFTPNTAAGLLVAVDGVILPQADYTLSGTTVTLGVAPTAGQSVYAYYPR